MMRYLDLLTPSAASGERTLPLPTDLLTPSRAKENLRYELTRNNELRVEGAALDAAAAALEDVATALWHAHAGGDDGRVEVCWRAYLAANSAYVELNDM